MFRLAPFRQKGDTAKTVENCILTGLADVQTTYLDDDDNGGHVLLGERLKEDAILSCSSAESFREKINFLVKKLVQFVWQTFQVSRVFVSSRYRRTLTLKPIEMAVS